MTRHPGPTSRRLLAVVLAAGIALLPACVDNVAGDSDSHSSGSEDTPVQIFGIDVGDPAASAEEILDGGHRAVATVAFSEDIGYDLSYDAVVASPQRYSVVASGGIQDVETIVADDVLYRRTGEGDLHDEIFAGFPASSSTYDALIDTENYDPFSVDPRFNSSIGLAFEALMFRLMVDPSSVIDTSAFADGSTSDTLVISDELEAALEYDGWVGTVVPVKVIRTNKRVSSVRVSLQSFVNAEVVVRYSAWGRTSDDDIEVPADVEVDPTPQVNEEELVAFTDTPYYAPTVLPEGLVLSSAAILPADQSLEGCDQLALEYHDRSPNADPMLDRTLSIFVLPRDCAEAAYSDDWDETIGGFQVRDDGHEVLVENSVVQVGEGYDVTTAERDAVIASLVPVTPDELIATVIANTD